jgi:cytochrome P450
MRRALRTIGPQIEQRIAATETGNLKAVPQDNVLTWHIEEALGKKEPREGSADVIACRVFAIMFAALESTTLTMTLALFNLCATDPTNQVWGCLEEEGRVAFSTKVGQTSVNGLEHADSAIKETLRLHTAIKALSVQVIQPVRVDFKGFNNRLPDMLEFTVEYKASGGRFSSS